MESRRQAKVNKLIQRELGHIFQKKAKAWFDLQFISVSQVHVSPDLGTAKVYLTFLNEKEPQKALEKVQNGSGEVKYELAKALKNEFRKLPELHFYYDDTLDYVDDMEKLFKKIKKNDD